MLNRAEWIFAAFAALDIGAVLLPINTALREQDLAFILRHSQCRVLVMAPRSGPVDYTAVLDAVAPELHDAAPGPLRLESLPALRWVVMLDVDRSERGYVSWADFVETLGGEAECDRLRSAVSPDALAVAMYTSGTTGTPKGVMHSHHGIRNVVDQANRMNVRGSDVLLMFLPLFHAYAFYEGPLLSLVTGARCVLLPRFDAGDALAALERHRATMCFGFSTHFSDLMDHPDFETTDRSSLRVSIMAVGPASMESVGRRVARGFGGRVISGYGMTELGPGAALGFLDEDEDHGAATSGYPLPGYEFRTIDPVTGAVQPRGTPGEVLIRGYQVTEGYLDEPVLTAAAIDADGWLHSGDVGIIQQDGYLRIVGRYKDMLRVGGENVDPAEVEALYAQHPCVKVAALVPVPDARLDEVGCLCVVRADAAGSADALRAELLHYVDTRLAAHKRPRHVAFVDELPMTASGKLQRHVLRDIAVVSLDLDPLSRSASGAHHA